MSYASVNHGFLIEGNVLFDDGGTNSLENQIRYIAVRKRYLEDSFPLFSIGLRTTEDFRNKLRDNDFSIYLRIGYYNNNSVNEESELDEQNITELGKIFEGIIRIYEKPYDTTAAKIEEETEGEETQVRSAPFVYYNINGIPEDAINKNETVINNSFYQCELADLLVYELTNIAPESNLHLQETENKTKYNIFIPPVSLIQGLKFVDEKFYRFYEHEANIFIESNDIYFYDPVSNNIPSSNIIECSVLTTTSTENLSNIQFAEVDSEFNLHVN